MGQPVSIPEGRTDLERLADVDGEFAVLSGVVYAAAINASSPPSMWPAAVLWTRELSSSASGLPPAKAWWLPVTSRAVWDWISRRHQREPGRPENRWLSTPAMVRQVALGDLEGYVHSRPPDGAFVARVRAGRDAIRSAPVSAGNVLYVVTVAGELTAYRVGG